MIFKSLHNRLNQYKLRVYKKRFDRLAQKLRRADSENKKKVLSEIEDLFSIVYLVGEMAIPLEMEIRMFVIRERENLKSPPRNPLIGLRGIIEAREGQRIKVSYLNKNTLEHKRASRSVLANARNQRIKKRRDW